MTSRALSSLLFVLPAAMATIAAAASCSGIQNQRIGIDAPPYSKQSFSPVGDYLANRCGTMDCHGQIGRNFRIYSCAGLRDLPDATPANCNQPTTDEEYQRTYRSLVGLEPQVMSVVYPGCSSSVAADGGDVYPPNDSCHPELLTFIQKARGVEAHKGGQLICVQAPCPDGIPNPIPINDAGGPLVDPQDVCLVSWLEGATDRHMCGLAVGIPTFPVPDAGTE